MHIYFLTRGLKRDVDRFIENLGSQHVVWETIDPKGKKKKWFVEVGVKPVQLWEVCIPEESFNVVANTIWDTPIPKFSAKENALLLGLRTALGAKKMPEINHEDKRMIVKKDNLGIYPIGIRKDKKGKQSEKSHEQEFL